MYIELAPLLLLVPGLTALGNRLLRGEGRIKKFLWIALMAGLAVGVAHIITPIDSWKLAGYLAGAWTLYFIGYAVPPTHAMFSAVHGRMPTRTDSPAFQWMQNISLYCWEHTDQVNARFYGVIYGTLRSLWMLPGVIAVWYVTGSNYAAVGLLAFLQGIGAYAAGKLSFHFGVDERLGAAFGELGIGWWHGTFMLIVAMTALWMVVL